MYHTLNHYHCIFPFLNLQVMKDFELERKLQIFLLTDNLLPMDTSKVTTTCMIIVMTLQVLAQGHLELLLKVRCLVNF